MTETTMIHFKKARTIGTLTPVNRSNFADSSRIAASPLGTILV